MIVLVLLIVLVLSNNGIKIRGIFLNIAAKPGDEAGHQRNDPHQNGFAGSNIVGCDFVAGDENIKAGGRFQGRSARDIKKPTPIGMRPFAVSFGDIQNDRGGGAIQLITRR